MTQTILILNPFFSPNVGGVETHLDCWIELLIKHKFRIKVLTYQPLNVSERKPFLEKKKGLEIFRLPFPGKWLFFWIEGSPALKFLFLTPPLLLFSFLYLYRNRNQIQVIDAHSIYSALIGKIFKIFWPEKKLIVWMHWIFELEKNQVLKKVFQFILKSANHIWVISSPSEKEVKSLGLQEIPIARYHSWVDQKHFKPLEREKIRSEYGFKNLFIILYIGRLVKEKGIEIIIQLARNLPSNFRIVVAGAGGMEPELKREAKKNQKLVFLGKVPESQLPELYNLADIFLMPVLHQEGLGRVILESVSCGTPIVASKKGGIVDVLSKEAGFLVDPPTRNNFKKLIMKLASNPKRLEKLRASAFAYAKKNFSIEKATKMLSVYE